MSTRRRHGSGPPPRNSDRAGTGPSKTEYLRSAVMRRKEVTSFLAAHREARFVPERACGKTRYASAADAQTALALVVRYGDCDGRFPIRAYACTACDGWHLTSWSAPDSPPPIHPSSSPNPS